MLKADRPGTVRLQGQQADIAPNSPLAILALFTEIVRERFRPGNDLSWVWVGNPTPTAEETNEPDAPRKLFIAPSYGVHSDIRNLLPAIVVTKGPTVTQKTVVNNLAGQQINTGKKGFYLPCAIPLTFTVISDQEAECAVLADIVWYYLLAARESVRAEFGIHEYTDPVLGETEPHPDVRDSFRARISMQAMIEFNWNTTPISPKIRSMALRLKSTYADSEEPLDQLALDMVVR